MAFNIGSGQSNWNKDLINMIVKKTNCKNYFDIQEAKNKEKFSLNIEKFTKKLVGNQLSAYGMELICFYKKKSLKI